ncbi:Cytochrome c oxidase subunit 6A [Escovopsis weberi]|uniref:Cytochrome c oxidase subunit n=1 Tax=Escovopsis weberi TaxID=150374 RepID=A0A0M9VWA4_ESCWE|nr:Cytochrome c oxidase subunit 6A [Escovopsis weberi]
MLAARQALRTAPRFAARARTPATRRMASTPAKATENEFIKEREHVKEHAASTTGDAVIPSVAIAAANAYWLWNVHWEHWSHMPPLEERTEYPYQNIRTKNFPWGDGDKTIFWNDEVNYHNKNKVV